MEVCCAVSPPSTGAPTWVMTTKHSHSYISWTVENTEYVLVHFMDCYTHTCTLMDFSRSRVLPHTFMDCAKAECDTHTHTHPIHSWTFEKAEC